MFEVRNDDKQPISRHGSKEEAEQAAQRYRLDRSMALTTYTVVGPLSSTFTRIVLPDGTGRTLSGQLGFQIGETIHKGDVAEWPELNGWRVYDRHFSETTKSNFRGIPERGSCLFLLVN